MQDQLDIEALRGELASLTAMLVDLESGKIPYGLGIPFEYRDRRTIIQGRIEKNKIDTSRGGSVINTERFKFLNKLSPALFKLAHYRGGRRGAFRVSVEVASIAATPPVERRDKIRAKYS